MPQAINDYNKADIWQELLRRKLATESLLKFTTFTKPDYQVNWHHELMCRKIDELLEGEIKRLIISCPPRMGKSEIVSRRLPAYVLGKNPNASIIACSYSADLASRMNRDVQRIIDSPEYSVLFPDTKLNYANVRTIAQGTYLRNSDLFEVVGHNGVYRSSGIGGAITGMGFSSIGIIDDPLKNREEAESKTIRDKIWEWYTDVFYTRRENDAPILVTQTRWHEDDLVGRLLDVARNDPDADQWEVLTLPAMSEETRPAYDIRTEPEQALWVDKFPEESLRQMKATVPLYTWLSLYQQRPSSAQGNIFKKESFRYAEFLTDDIIDLGTKKVLFQKCKVFQTCDPAASTKTTADFFVLATWAHTPENDLILLDLLRTRLEGPDQINLFKQQHIKWKPAFQAVEAVGVGKTLYQMLVREGLPVKELKADTDKITRALPAAARMEAGAVFFLQGTSWLNDLEEELLSFPNGAHDDQVDSVAFAASVITANPFRSGSFDITKMLRTRAK